MNTPTEPGYYLYHCPGWTGKMRVKVEKHRRDGLVVRFKDGYFPTMMRDIPAVAVFEPTTEGKLRPI